MNRDIRAGYSTARQITEPVLPSVLLLLCSLKMSSVWPELLEKMGQSEHQFTLFDFPDHDESLKRDFCAAFHDVSTVVAVSFLDQKMDQIGDSFGASVMLRRAVRHPDLVRVVHLDWAGHFLIRLCP